MYPLTRVESLPRMQNKSLRQVRIPCVKSTMGEAQDLRNRYKPLARISGEHAARSGWVALWITRPVVMMVAWSRTFKLDRVSVALSGMSTFLTAMNS
jgi:hypothetical protein